MQPKIFVGPMTRNVVDACISFAAQTEIEIGLIPSRRQVECTGGYVNRWTTKDFCDYSRRPYITLQRDHAGPLQGDKPDNGLVSLEEDCSNFDLIHIDPWKAATSIKDGIARTIGLILYCEKFKRNVRYEIGTEEAIFQYNHKDLKKIIEDVTSVIAKPKIKYAVIQSGTSLCSNVNTGQYDESRLKSMVEVCRDCGLLSKEHNGDFLETSIVMKKFELGLDAINVAPEFGQIETKAYLEAIKNNNRHDLYNLFFAICRDSDRWKKWFPKDHNPESDKEALIMATGHYTFSFNNFIMISKEFPEIPETVKTNVFKRLRELNGI